MQYHAIIVTQHRNLKETEMETIMTPKLMHSLSKIITEVRNSTGIDEVHVEALEEILQAAYDAGEDAGYDAGFNAGYDAGYYVGRME